ncbi:hypothetical protein [Cyanobium sp. Morenito 9A2]|uniref:hypothetical protein n=1 Tax=Cyanobium sp. Morenito 9A2 TaxID=2823718 RepID=UPI0020CE0633|nr:hypothetical protein [Cyanobium sp. Morenito 9A2]MCP9849776.1 hypothetical protein [Cyanobium sp. Morenito 9A2]
MKAVRPLLVWFANSHEHSLHYLKFGLMQMARQGEICLEERNTATAHDWLPQDLRQRSYRRIVLLGVQWGGQRRLVAVDGEDSPFQLSDLIERVDRYYTCTYCPFLFQEQQFRIALPWQSDAEIRPYRQRFGSLVNRYGDQFHKVRPWAPIGPDLECSQPQRSWSERKLGNLRHKLQLRWCGTLDWQPQLERFSARWEHIKALRTEAPTVDVVLLDSLWGWPRHRIALHSQLANLAAQGYGIRSQLNHREPEADELGDAPAPDPADFPMQVGEPIGENYEQLLAQSRLGAFATGFHYGWRSIVTLAWALGLKTLQDPFTYTFLYDPAPFQQRLGPEGWQGLSAALDGARMEDCTERKRRWEHFDHVAAPERLAAIIVETTLKELS